MNLQVLKYMRAGMVVLALAGYGTLIAFNWRVALGVFLVHWSIKIELKHFP